MLYEFNCLKCELTKEVYRLVQDASLPEYCDLCNGEMKRVYSVPQAIIKNNSYNPGLNCKQKDVGDALKRHYDNTGIKLQEVGNETVKPKARIRYNYEKETQQAKQLLGIS